MKEINTDVLIVGSGLVGLVAAHSLSSLNYNVLIIDKKKPLNTKSTFKDTRTVAVSEGSKFFLESLLLWDSLDSYAEPIKKIKVFDRSSKNKILFNNQIINKNLGYVIKNIKFSQILQKKLLNFKKTTSIYGETLNQIKVGEKKITAYSNKLKIHSKLLVAADGKNSDIKKMVGNKTFKKDYSEQALVLSFVHEKNLRNTAYEIFYNTGPLAILPMKSFKNKNISTIIWSNKAAFLERLINTDNKFLLNLIEEKISGIVGKIIKVSSKQIFPLSAHINDSFANKRLIYVGDAAHSIHPIAGQGWNLGVKDVKNLHEISKTMKVDFGNDLFCKKYNELSYNKAFQLYQITDKLNTHFKANISPYRLLSYAGFNIIENSTFVKNKITKYAMGF